MGAIAILGVGLIHLVLGILLLATGWRALQGEILPRLRASQANPLDWAFSIFGGIGWTIIVALFCFLVVSRTIEMLG